MGVRGGRVGGCCWDPYKNIKPLLKQQREEARQGKLEGFLQGSTVVAEDGRDRLLGVSVPTRISSTYSDSRGGFR